MANEIVEEIYFNGGLDSDSDEKFIQQGDYVDALNVVKVEDGEGGILVNIKGNEALYTSSKSTEEYLCGWAYYNKNESVILLLHIAVVGSEYSSIIEFNPHTLVSTTIIDGSSIDVLGFQNPKTSDYFISAKMSGDWLSLADNNQDPMLMNVQSIKDNSPTITYDYLINIKKPPFIAAEGIYGYDSGIDFTNVTGSFYKFKYRYTYSEFRKSVWSASSELSVSNVDMMAIQNSFSPDAPNYIYVKFNSGDEDVEFIEIAYLQSDAGNWSKDIIVDKISPTDVYSIASPPVLQTSLSDNTNYYYKFVNSGSYEAIDSDEILKAYDNIPIRAEACTFIGDDRLVYGGGVYGYDVDDVDVDVTLTPSYAAVESETSVSGTESYDNGGGNCTVEFEYDLTSLFSSGAKEGDIINFSFAVSVSGIAGSNGYIILESVIVFSHDMSSLSDTVTYIAAKATTVYATSLSTPPDSTDISLSGNDIVFSAVWNGEAGTGITVVVDDTYSIVVDNVFSTFTRNQKKHFGIVYYDDHGRKSPVLIGDGSVVNIKDFYDTTNDGIVDIDFTINHTAPSWAKYYRWAYTKNIQPFVSVYTGGTWIKSYDSDGDRESGVWAIDVSTYVNEYSTDQNEITLGNFTLEVGDLVKRLYSKTASYIDVEANEYRVFDIRTTLYATDAPVEYTGLYLMIRPDESLEIDSNPAFGDNFYVLRVRKSSATNDKIYYEVGDYGTCSSGSHSPSSGTLTEGDAWMKWVTIENGNEYGAYSLYKMESYYPAGNTIDYISNADRINIIDETFRQEYENIISWSDKYLQDTKINGFNSFYLTDSSGTPVKKEVSQMYGNIKGLEELGNSLIVICEEKVLSGFVGATEYTDAEGNVTAAISTTPVGYLRPHAEWYGTFFKESIINTGKHIYFFDLFNGVVVRKSANGLFPISGRVDSPQGSYDYKMRTYFKDKSKALIETLYDGIASSSVSGIIANYENVKCFMGYDPYYENIYITFMDRTTVANNSTLIFHEPSNRWIGKYTSMTGNNKTTLFPFTKSNIFSYQEVMGSFYLMNSDNVDRCYLYGEARDSYIQFVSHAAPNQIKIFNALGIHSTKQYTVDPIEISANSTYRSGMYSKLVDSEFELVEGVYRASMPMNMKTSGTTASNYDRLNGDQMRGKVIKMKLTNDDTEEVQLFKVDISSNISK